MRISFNTKFPSLPKYHFLIAQFLGINVKQDMFTLCFSHIVFFMVVFPVNLGVQKEKNRNIASSGFQSQPLYQFMVEQWQN